MRIDNKKFPYPLLKSKGNNTDYKSTQFSFDFNQINGTPIISNNKLVLKNIHFSLDNSELKELYCSGFLKALCMIECSNTVYRECFELYDEPRNKEFSISKFSNTVRISAYLVAIKEIKHFKSNDFVEDYEGYDFNINAFDILAVGDEKTFNVYTQDGDNKTSSIFTIVKKDDAQGLISYNNGPKKITIYLNPKDYNIYDMMKNHSAYNSMFFSNLVIPVLSNCLQEIQREFNEICSLEEICENKIWFQSVLNRYLYVTGKKLEVDDFCYINCFELAQMVMDESTDKSIKDFYGLIVEGEGKNDG